MISVSISFVHTRNSSHIRNIMWFVLPWGSLFFLMSVGISAVATIIDINNNCVNP